MEVKIVSRYRIGDSLKVKDKWYSFQQVVTGYDNLRLLLTDSDGFITETVYSQVEDVQKRTEIPESELYAAYFEKHLNESYKQYFVSDNKYKSRWLWSYSFEVGEDSKANLSDLIKLEEEVSKTFGNLINEGYKPREFLTFAENSRSFVTQATFILSDDKKDETNAE